MAKTRKDYPSYKKSISDEMKRRQAKAHPDAEVPNQIIEVKWRDYERLKNLVSAQLRRKLAGEFPYNAIGREVEVSTNTFWMELLTTHAEAYWEHCGYPSDLYHPFVESVGAHPAAWKSIDDIETLEHMCDDFAEKHRGG